MPIVSVSATPVKAITRLKSATLTSRVGLVGGGGKTILGSRTTSSFVNDAGGINVGVKFKSDVAGSITGIRFYKVAADNGPHVGTLYTPAGVVLATVTFTGETATGWQVGYFTEPVSISAGVTYVAAIFRSKASYAYQHFGLSTPIDTPPLHTIAPGVSANGVYDVGTVPALPASTFRDTNYFVDVVLIEGVSKVSTITRITSAVLSGITALSGTKILAVHRLKGAVITGKTSLMGWVKGILRIKGYRLTIYSPTADPETVEWIIAEQPNNEVIAFGNNVSNIIVCEATDKVIVEAKVSTVITENKG